MLKIVRSTARKIVGLPAQWMCKREFESQSFTRFNERPVEFAFVFRKLAEIYPVNVLDVGTGTTALPHLMRNCGCLVTAIDNIQDYWSLGMINRHYHVIHDDIRHTKLTSKFDFITCISVLEHIENAKDAVRSMLGLLNDDGHLILTCPYSEREYVRNVYKLPGSSYGQSAPYITQSFSRKELDSWLQDDDVSIVEQEYWQFWDGDFWTVGQQIIPAKRASADDKHQLTCIHIHKTK